MAQRYRRQIAPRLANGQSRISFGHGLPPAIKEGIRRIAEREHKSMSWVMEEVIIEFFHLRRPQYVTPKGPTPPGPDPKKETPTK